MSEHRPVHIWQERPGEFSYICSCGMHMKHQQFGEWPVCLSNVRRPDLNESRRGSEWLDVPPPVVIAEPIDDPDVGYVCGSCRGLGDIPYCYCEPAKEKKQ